MKCEEIKNLLPAYQDGELSPGKAEETRVHLTGCASCQKEEQLLSTTWDLLGSLEPIEPSPDFRARLWEKIRAEEERKPRWQLAPRYVYAFGFVAVWFFGVGIGSLVFLRSPNVRSMSQPISSAPFQFTNSSSIENVYLNRWKGGRT